MIKYIATVTVSSDSGTPLYGIELFGTESSMAGLLGIEPDLAADDLSGAQLAYGPDVDTTINLVNVGQSGRVVLTAMGENGKIVHQNSLNLDEYQQLRVSAKDLFGSDGESFVGWLQVDSTAGKLLGIIVFEDPKGEFSASLPMQKTGAREFIFSHVAQSEDIYTGITLLNSGARTALVSLEVFNASGEKVGFTFQEIKPLGKRALLLSEWIPEIKNQLGGFIRVRSNEKLQGFELFGSRNYLSAVPRLITVE